MTNKFERITWGEVQGAWEVSSLAALVAEEPNQVGANPLVEALEESHESQEVVVASSQKEGEGVEGRPVLEVGQGALAGTDQAA